MPRWDGKTAEERFWSRISVTEAGCWEWSGPRFAGKEYGAVSIDGEMRRAHRVAWRLVNGPIPDGLCVCHRCDNPRCVRAEPGGAGHLFLGTQEDNVRDRDAKGRTARGARSGRHTHPETSPRGERHGRAKLNAGAVAAIRREYAAGGKTLKGLGASFGVGTSTVSRVVNGKNWTPTKSEG